MTLLDLLNALDTNAEVAVCSNRYKKSASGFTNLYLEERELIHFSSEVFNSKMAIEAIRHESLEDILSSNVISVKMGSYGICIFIDHY